MEGVSPQNTPMMKQWRDLKSQAGDALLFFRLGDFYELFEDDAVTAAPVLGVTLTSRNNKGEGPSSPLCGVPVSTLENYLTKALNKGFKIALAEQVELPQKGKTLVRREIIQWFTPGIRFLPNEELPHYLGILSGSFKDWILATADVGTGHMVLEKGQGLDALKEILLRLPVEDLRMPPLQNFENEFKQASLCTWSSIAESETLVRNALGLSSNEDSPAKTKTELQTLGTLFRILNEAHPKDTLRFLRPTQNVNEVWLPANTKKSLNLFEPDEKSLFSFLNKTQTALGRRELKGMLSSPTQDLNLIQKRQSLIKFFKSNPILRKTFRTELTNVLDLHRLLRKRRGPLELLQISKTLSAVVAAGAHLSRTKELPEFLFDFVGKAKQLVSLAQELARSVQISEEVDLGWIQTGVRAELDELRELQAKSHQVLKALEEKLRDEFKISTLKIKFHQVFGYVIEVTSLHKDKVPSYAKRIQTLANAERFKIEELSQIEEKLLSLETRLREAESSEIQRLYDQIESNRNTILEIAQLIGGLDAFQSLAEVSEQNYWTTPITTDEAGILEMKNAWHPLSTGAFVPLSMNLSATELQILLLTGPNMSGKSTLLRLAATVALLHQIGSDVPSESARLSIFDRIVCRMGAADDMASGQSTFFVEMREVSSMLHGASEKSLLILDEIGRGTSTFDGMSLAWAITEEVHTLQALSLVATHYLELSELQQKLPRLKSYHLGVEESEGKLIFTRRLQEGCTSRSYGIEVARLAQVPSSILSRAEKKLKEFEKKRAAGTSTGPLFEWNHPG